MIKAAGPRGFVLAAIRFLPGLELVNSHVKPSGLLVIGYGNTIRGDDGVGPRVAEAVDALRLPGVRTLVCQQLSPEHAASVAEAEAVIFVDAAVGAPRVVQFRRLEPNDTSQLLAHAADPRTVLALSRDVFGYVPDAWWLTIPAEKLDFSEEFTPSARRGCDEAIRLIQEFCIGSLPKPRQPAAPSPAGAPMEVKPSIRHDTEKSNDHCQDQLLGRAGVRTLPVLGAILLLLCGKPHASAASFAFTQPAQPVTAAQATLNGMVTPNGLPTAAWFEWGTNLDYGQTTAPVEAGDGSSVVRVSAAIADLLPGRIYHCRLVCSNASGLQMGFDQPFAVNARVVAWGQNNLAQPGLAAGLSRVVAIAAGSSHNLALRNDGTVVAWGDNAFGQTNVPAALSNVWAIAGGNTYSLALKGDGTVVKWGTNSTVKNVPAGLSNVIAIAAGSGHALALKENGKVVAWGDNTSGKTNVPVGLSNVVAIAAGQAHSLALRADGTVAGWGANTYGQINVPAGLSNVVAVAAGGGASLALKSDGTLVLWSTAATNVVTSNVVAVSACANYTVALKEDDSVVTWGSASPPTNLPPVAAIGSGGLHNLALVVPRAFAFTQAAQPVTTTNAALNGMVTPNGLPTLAWFEWGADAGYGQTTTPVNVGDGFVVVRVDAPVIGLAAAEVYHFRVVASNALGLVRGADQRFTTGRRVAAWGRSTIGSAIPPAGLGDVVQVAAGDLHGVALKPDGTVRTWGYYVPGLAAAPSPDLTNAMAIAGGAEHSVALRSDGSVVAWGNNASGQTDVPSGLSNVVAISAGDVHTCALKADGTVTGWGQFGDFNSWPFSVPAGLSNVVAIASGDTHCLALKNDGTITGWGANNTGQRAIPADLKDVQAIAAGWQYGLALKADRTVVGWGQFDYTRAFYVPSGLTNVVAIASGDTVCLALKDTGEVVQWGYNNAGPLAAQAAGLSNAVAVAGGDQLCFALAPNVMPQATSLSVTGAVNVDWTVTLKGTDPNGDAVSYRISALPTNGSLFQYTTNGRGAAIEAPGTGVTDELGRVWFVPDPDTSAMPYTTFGFVAVDGALDSASGTVTVNIIPQPMFTAGSISVATNGAFSLRFTGVSNAMYGVWASSNLVNWSRRGSATQPAPGQFLFTDTTASNFSWRFYRVSSP